MAIGFFYCLDDMEQNPKSIEATVIAKDAVDDEPTVARSINNASKKKKRAAGRARVVTAVPTKASAASQAASAPAKGKKVAAPSQSRRTEFARLESNE